MNGSSLDNIYVTMNRQVFFKVLKGQCSFHMHSMSILASTQEFLKKLYNAYLHLWMFELTI